MKNDKGTLASTVALLKWKMCTPPCLFPPRAAAEWPMFRSDALAQATWCTLAHNATRRR